MTVQQIKRDVISKITNLEDEALLKKSKLVLEEALPDKPQKPRQAGWGKGLITYVSDDFDDFIPPGFYGEEEDDASK